MIDIEALKAEMKDAQTPMKDDSPSLLSELDDSTTAATGAVGAVLIGTLAFDAIKNKSSEDGERLFQGSLGWAIGLSGALLLGLSLGRLARGNLAQKDAEDFTKMIHKLEADYEAEKESEKEKKTKQKNHIDGQAMMLTNPEQFTLAPIPYVMGLGFGEYGNAVGQSLLTYAHKR